MANHPNRSGRNAPGRTPTTDEIRALRELHGLTQTQFADVIHGTLRAVQDYEGGQRRMHPAIFGYAMARLGAALEPYVAVTRRKMATESGPQTYYRVEERRGNRIIGSSVMPHRLTQEQRDQSNVKARVRLARKPGKYDRSD